MERKKKLVVCFILGRSGGGMGWQFGTWESIYISISTHLLLRFFFMFNGSNLVVYFN